MGVCFWIHLGVMSLCSSLRGVLAMHYWMIYPSVYLLYLTFQAGKDPDEHLDSLVYVVTVFVLTLCLQSG